MLALFPTALICHLRFIAVLIVAGVCLLTWQAPLAWATTQAHGRKAGTHEIKKKQIVGKRSVRRNGGADLIMRQRSLRGTQPMRGHIMRVIARPKLRTQTRKDAPLEDARILFTRSGAALVQDAESGKIIYQKNAREIMPVASITKLLTAIVVLDATPDLQETLTITEEDVDGFKGSSSHIPVGAELPRETLLNLALMSSDNRAAYCLSRHYPGGRAGFVAAMNQKAAALGMHNSHFEDPTGLTPLNISTAQDLARLVAAAYAYPLIREFSTAVERWVDFGAGRQHLFHNSNALVRGMDWAIDVSKTGYIKESGRCVVMRTWFNNRPTLVVLLDAQSSSSRLQDAARIKRWSEENAALNEPRNEPRPG